MTENAGVDATFEHASTFEPTDETSGNVRIGKLEGYYEELFAEVIEDGVITPEERARLDRMADSFGLDRERLRRLEQALQAAYEARHRVAVRDMSGPAAHGGPAPDEPPPASIAPLEPATDVRTLALERRIAYLQARVEELERLLEEARAQVAVEVDVSDLGPTAAAVPDDDPVELARRVRRDPRDLEALHALYRHHGRAGDRDRQWCTAQVLVYLNAADAEEQELFEAHRTVGLIRPRSALGRDAWNRLLLHPEQEPLVGEIFSVVVSAVLIGRLSAMRRDKTLLKLDPAKKQDLASTTLQAARCVGWAAATFGMGTPGVYADPEHEGGFTMVPAVPPALRLGAAVLSGRSATELAFLVGRELASMREEHFVRLLVPDVRSLEDIFLAALSIGNPGLPLSPQVKQLVLPIAKAIEPVLEPALVDRLRGQFLRFVEEGGRTNLQRWSAAVDKTCARAGLLLANDLATAHAVLASEDASTADAKMDDLLSFVLSDRYTMLRKQLGIALGSSSQ